MNNNTSYNDVTGVTPHEEWIECKACHYPMRRLADFEFDDLSESPAVDARGDDVFWFGWGQSIMMAIARYVKDELVYAGRKLRIERAKTAILPQFPNSLVCPWCQRVERIR